MSKLKIVEIVASAGAALLAAVKSVIKFIDYIVKLREKQPAAASSA